MEAVVDNDMDEARSLLTQGKGGLTADPNFSDEFGFSCLHVCAKVSFRHFLIPCSFSVLLSTYYRHALSSLLPPPSSLHPLLHPPSLRRTRMQREQLATFECIRSLALCVRIL